MCHGPCRSASCRSRQVPAVEPVQLEQSALPGVAPWPRSRRWRLALAVERRQVVRARDQAQDPQRRRRRSAARSARAAPCSAPAGCGRQHQVVAVRGSYRNSQGRASQRRGLEPQLDPERLALRLRGVAAGVEPAADLALRTASRTAPGRSPGTACSSGGATAGECLPSAAARSRAPGAGAGARSVERDRRLERGSPAGELMTFSSYPLSVFRISSSKSSSAMRAFRDRSPWRTRAVRIAPARPARNDTPSGDRTGSAG